MSGAMKQPKLIGTGNKTVQSLKRRNSDDTGYDENYSERKNYETNSSKHLQNEGYTVREKRASSRTFDCENRHVFRKESYLLQSEKQRRWTYWLFLGVIAIVIALFKWKMYYPSSKDLNEEIKKLKEKYPNQENELWMNFLKITNEKEPSVQTLILTYNDESIRPVSECLAEELVKLIKLMNPKEYSYESILKFNNEEAEKAHDFGNNLEHYKKLVKEHHQLIVPNLHSISWKTARLFHYLCDDVSSPIKPSYFIFTLENIRADVANSRNRMTAAGITLRNNWREGPENELSPLLSRLLGSVIDVQYEHDLKCNVSDDY